MGGSSKSSATTTSKVTNTDQSLVDSSNGDGSRTNTAIGGSITGDVNISSTDHGAIKAAESVAEKAFGFAGGASKDATQLAESALKTVKESTSESVGKFASLAEQVKTDGQAQTGKLIAAVVLALILAGTIVAVAINRNGKKS